MTVQIAPLRILRTFGKYSAARLVPFGANVGTNLDATKFPNLKVDPKTLLLMADDLKTKLAATLTGGSATFAAKDKAFDTLVAALNANADVVELSLNGDLELLLSTGYLPASNNRTSSPLDDTAIVALLNNGTTQLFLQLMPVTNARTYQVQTSTDGGKTWVEAALSTKAIRIVIPNLVPATAYVVRARAIGGSTGASGWAVSGSIICT